MAGMEEERYDRPDRRALKAEDAWRVETGAGSLPKEEMSAELAAWPNVAGQARTDRPRNAEAESGTRLAPHVRDSQAEAGRSLGLFALGMAIASLFVWPLLLGLTAAVLGYVSFRQGARALGIWSVTIGLLAAAAYLVFIPFLTLLS